MASATITVKDAILLLIKLVAHTDLESSIAHVLLSRQAHASVTEAMQ